MAPKSRRTPEARCGTPAARVPIRAVATHRAAPGNRGSERQACSPRTPLASSHPATGYGRRQWLEAPSTVSCRRAPVRSIPSATGAAPIHGDSFLPGWNSHDPAVPAPSPLRPTAATQAAPPALCFRRAPPWHRTSSAVRRARTASARLRRPRIRAVTVAVARTGTRLARPRRAGLARYADPARSRTAPV